VTLTLLTLHGHEIRTVFDLLGQKETDMTYALGWALSQSPQFMARLAETLQRPTFSERVRLRLQEHKSLGGYTDLEIDDPRQCHIILEAKRGFIVPSKEQLTKYAARLINAPDRPKVRLLVILADSDRQNIWLNIWLKKNIPGKIEGVTVKSISWHEFKKLAQRAAQSGTHDERHLLREFIAYLARATVMQNQNSNLVYVVSLSHKEFRDGTEISFIDVVEKYKKYFHPIGGTGGGWPFEPPNYLGFRYGGELKSIHHVESYTVIENFKPHFTRKSIPTRRVPTNSNGHSIFRAARKWAFIDLLLTAGSIAEAAHLTRQRQAKAKQDEAGPTQ
jgi:hypothetical protein